MRGLRPTTVLTSTLLAFLVSHLSGAQTNSSAGSSLAARPDAIDQFRRAPNTRKLGPFYLSPLIVVSNAGVNTNVNYSQDVPLQNNTLTMTASLEALLPIGRHTRLFAYGSLSPNYFNTEVSARSLDRGGSLRAELDLGPISPFVFVGASKAKQRFSTEVDERLWYADDTKGFGATARVTHRMALTLAGTENTPQYDHGVVVGGADVADALDRRSRNGTGEISYALSKRTNLLVRGEIIEDVFLGSTASPGETVRSNRYLGGVSFTSSSRLGGQLLAGVRQFPVTSTPSAPAYTGLALQTGLSLPLGGLSLSLAADRDVRYAVAPSQSAESTLRNSFIYSLYRVTTSVDMPWSLLLRPEVRFERSSYLLPYPTGDSFADRRDDLWTVGVGLLRRFGQRVAIGGTFEHSKRSTTIDGLNYSGDRYGLTASILP